MTRDLVLYDSAISGNAYKVRLLLSHLGLKFQRIEFNVDDGSTRTAEFLAKNPNGKVPTIRLADGTYLFESNAILYYFAEGTNYWPAGKRERAAALQWMFFEQYSHEPYIAVVRHWVAHLGKTPQNEPQLPMRTERGYHALDVMEKQKGSGLSDDQAMKVALEAKRWARNRRPKARTRRSEPATPFRNVTTRVLGATIGKAASSAGSAS